MYVRNRFTALFGALCLLTQSTFLLAAPGQLSLLEAERMALANDPMSRAIASRGSALAERSVAAAQLPDPVLRLGALALPVNSFDLDQEPMTQLQIGFQQRFARGESRVLAGRSMSAQSGAQQARLADRKRRTGLAVRQSYIDVLLQRDLASLLAESEHTLAQWADFTRDAYASGRVLQADVIRSEVERLRVLDRVISSREAENEARSRLAEWIGAASKRPLPESWPMLSAAERTTWVPDDFRLHPLALSFEAEMEAAEHRVGIAREAYKPQWSVDVAYGFRSGENPDGSGRSDFFSAMVMLDLPLFRDKRQDRQLAAAGHEYDATLEIRNDALRQLSAQAEQASAALARARQRIDVIESQTLPEAQAWNSATQDAYRSGVGQFDDLLLAVLAVLDVRTRLLHTRADEFRALARLIYLTETSS